MFLATIDGKSFPHIRSVENLRNPERFPHQSKLFTSQEDFVAFISTNTSSSKVQHVQQNPNVALYFCQPKAYQGAMLTGVAAIEEGYTIKEQLWEENMRLYYPQGLIDPDFAVIRVIPSSIKVYNQLESSFTDLRDA